MEVPSVWGLRSSFCWLDITSNIEINQDCVRIDSKSPLIPWFNHCKDVIQQLTSQNFWIKKLAWDVPLKISESWRSRISLSRNVTVVGLNTSLWDWFLLLASQQPHSFFHRMVLMMVEIRASSRYDGNSPEKLPTSAGNSQVFWGWDGTLYRMIFWSFFFPVF